MSMKALLLRKEKGFCMLSLKFVRVCVYLSSVVCVCVVYVCHCVADDVDFFFFFFFFFFCLLRQNTFEKFWIFRFFRDYYSLKMICRPYLHTSDYTNTKVAWITNLIIMVVRTNSVVFFFFFNPSICLSVPLHVVKNILKGSETIETLNVHNLEIRMLK